MKRFKNLIVLSVVLFFANSIFATTAENFHVYIVNHTPYAIYLGNSNWDKTPLMFYQRKIPAEFPLAMVASGDVVDGSASVAFRAKIGDGPETYLNTVVVTYSFNTMHSLKVDPPYVVIVDKQVYFPVKVIYYDQGSSDIVLEIGSK